MHGRYRGPVNGNRSSSMGVRASPERFARGRGEYRNYSRGRGQSKQFGLPHGNEIFMEAGRLAAEYLVSKGVLHPSALAGKYQNGSLKNSVGEFQGFRSQEADFMGVPVEGRISAIPRLGSAAGDVGHGRKRFPEDYNSMSSRSFVRESRRNETARNYGSEFDRELGRVGSWNRVRNSPDVDAQDNDFSGNRAEQKVAKNSDAVLQSSPPRKIDPVIESSGDSLIDSDSAGQNKAGDDAGKKASPIRIEINLQLEDERQHTEKCIEMETSKIEVDQVAVSNDNCDLETKSAKEDIEVEPCAEEHMHTSKSTEEHTQMTKSSNNLLSVWRFEHVPKKTRSSLANRVLKVFDNAVIKDENAREMELPKDTQMHSELNHVDVSAGVISSPHSHDARNLDSGKSEPLNLEEESRSSQVIKQVNEPLDLEEESRSSQVIKQVNETDSSSLGDSMVIKEDETIVELRGFESCNSINLERGEKRALEHDDDCIGRTKKPRELVSSMCSLSDAILYHSSSMEDWSNSQEPGTSHGEGVLLSLDEKKLVDIPLVTKSDVESGTDFTGKQLFPGSLKTCDLNLLEASVVNETQNADPINIFPGITGSVKEEAPVDIDLTMSSNCNTASQYAKSAFDHIDIEVIDLDNDSEQEDKALNNPDTRSEVVFTGSDGFSNNPHGTDDTTDVQDGYGLMISELLGSDIPRCSSVPENMNSFHNDMGPHNGEGVLGDDDSIYMSLGEIPISFLTAWEQQTQEFGKPF